MRYAPGHISYYARATRYRVTVTAVWRAKRCLQVATNYRPTRSPVQNYFHHIKGCYRKSTQAHRKKSSSRCALAYKAPLRRGRRNPVWVIVCHRPPWRKHHITTSCCCSAHIIYANGHLSGRNMSHDEVQDIANMLPQNCSATI